MEDIGDHVYTVSELNNAGENWTYDTEARTVTVTVSDGGNGKLNATVHEWTGSQTFENKYVTPDTPTDPIQTTTTAEDTTEYTTVPPVEITTGNTTEATTENTTEATTKSTTEATTETNTESTAEADTEGTTESAAESTTENTAATESTIEGTTDNTATTEAAIEFSTETPTVGVSEPTSGTDVSATTEEPPSKTVVVITTPDGDIEIEVYEYMPGTVIPLGNGWFAVYLDDDYWEIFDEDGMPLGMIKLPKDMSIEDCDIKFIELNLVPFTGVLPIDKGNISPQTEENETSGPQTEDKFSPQTEDNKPNPKTGDNMFLIFALLGFMGICGVIAAAGVKSKAKNR